MLQLQLAIDFGEKLDKVKKTILEKSKPKYLKKDVTEINLKFDESTVSGQGANRLIKHFKNLNKGVMFVHCPLDGKPFLKNESTSYVHKPNNNRNQYPCWSVAGKSVAIHRLLGWLFINNSDPNKLTKVDHKDGDKYNYNLNNLEWVSNGENIRRANAQRKDKKPKVGIGLKIK